MGTYTIAVNIDMGQYPKLKVEGYKLCIARKIMNQYNVVWFGTDYLQHNWFQWQDSYGLFCSHVFESGSPVQSSTVSRPIASGQTCLLDADGTLHPAMGSCDNSGTFYLDNQYGPIHLGVDGFLRESLSPIFVSPDEVTPGLTTITPGPVTIMAWFDLHLTTGTMFSESFSNAIEVPYQGPYTLTITYLADGTWTIRDAELGFLSVAPTSSELVTDHRSNIKKLPVALLAYGTDIALDRDACSETAVIGDRHENRSEHQEWRFIPSHIRGHFIIEGLSGGTYLSIEGQPKEGATVIHSPKRMDWKVELFNEDIRISVPGTDYCIELGKFVAPEKGQVHEIVLAKQLLQDDPANKQLWKPRYTPDASAKQ